MEWMAAGAGGRDDYGDDNEDDCSRGCCHSHLQDGLQLLQLGLLLLDLTVVVLEQLQQQEPSDVQHLLHTREEEEERAPFQLSVEEAHGGRRPLQEAAHLQLFGLLQLQLSRLVAAVLLKQLEEPVDGGQL